MPCGAQWFNNFCYWDVVGFNPNEGSNLPYRAPLRTDKKCDGRMVESLHCEQLIWNEYVHSTLPVYSGKILLLSDRTHFIHHGAYFVNTLTGFDS